MATEDEFIQAQIIQIEARITAVQAAILTVANGGVSYSLDDGQIRQSVTRASLGDLTRTLNALYATRATLLAQLGRASINVRPSF